MVLQWVQFSHLVKPSSYPLAVLVVLWVKGESSFVYGAVHLVTTSCSGCAQPNQLRKFLIFKLVQH